MLAGDTIVAVSTPPGRGGIGVVRLSGPAAVEIAARVVKLPPGMELQPWRSHLAALPDRDGQDVDQVVVAFFAQPRSYTGENVVEISCHGAPVVLRYCVERCAEEGARLASPGEYTFRAFLNGRIDLAQAEAVRDLIEATTLYQARVACQQAEGSVSRRLAPIKAQLLDLIALLEAGIDFAEDDVSVATPAQIHSRLHPIRQAVSAMLDSFAYGRLVHSGLAIAIVGRPNVGKSSLFNRLLEQERAIVTEIPGTTRDLVSETAAIHGIPVRLVDTAGIRTGEDLVERLGIERSYQAMADADLTLVVLDLSVPLAPEDHHLLQRAHRQRNFLIVGNKADLPPQAEVADSYVPVSALTGEGTPALREAIFEAIAPASSEMREAGFITNLRHQQHLEEAQRCLAQAATAVEENIPHEMLLLDLYGALQAIDALTGATTADDILNRIFATFCIGK